MASKVSREILTVPQAKAMADAWARSMHLGGEGARFEGALLAMRHKLAAPVALVPADSDEDKVLEQNAFAIAHAARAQWPHAYATTVAPREEALLMAKLWVYEFGALSPVQGAINAIGFGLHVPHHDPARFLEAIKKEELAAEALKARQASADVSADLASFWAACAAAGGGGGGGEVLSVSDPLKQEAAAGAPPAAAAAAAAEPTASEMAATKLAASANVEQGRAEKVSYQAVAIAAGPSPAPVTTTTSSFIKRAD